MHVIVPPFFLYSLLASLGYACFTLVLYRLLSAEKYWTVLRFSIFIIALFCSFILCARILTIWEWKEYFSSHPIEILIFWKGGIGYMVGFTIVAPLIYLVYGKIHRIKNVMRLFDSLALALPIPHIIGKIGCFLNGCCMGKIANVPWSVMYSVNNRIIASENLANKPLHPVQVYDMAHELICLLLLIFLKRKVKSEGILFPAYLIFYGFGRFITENYRWQPEYYWRPFSNFMTIYQFLGLLWIITGILIVYFQHGRLRNSMLSV
jgi:phosphatidylglycerol---prolipoprotein diacylglyceryl transferase